MFPSSLDTGKGQRRVYSMDFLELVNNSTKKGIEVFGDNAAKKFYELLKQHKFYSTKCADCKNVFFHPRNFCPACGNENIEWIELSGKGKLYAFTWQEKATRFLKPDCIGIVETQEGFLLVTKIDAPFESLHIGMDMEVAFVDVSKDLTLHAFAPARK